MDNKNETEAEMKERLRKEILDELNRNDNNPNKGDIEIQSFGPPKKHSTVSFNSDAEKNKENIVVNTATDIEKKEEKTPATVEKNSKSSLLLIGICVIIVLIAILLFPMISRKLDDYKNSMKKPTTTIPEEKEVEYEKITLNSEIISQLKYPIMHNDRTNKTTYYNNDKITISNFSNNDILYNALLDVLKGNIAIAKYTGKYSGQYCGTKSTKVAIDARYIGLRIENLYTTKAAYNYTNITIPTNNTNTQYVGTWKYDARDRKYIYYGNCGKVPTSNIEYYDIKVPYEASSSDKNIEIYVDNNVAFATVDRTAKTYILYKNANYTEEITRGSLSTTNYQNELTNIVKNLDNNSTKTYRYTFTIRDCAYQDYCFLSGEWKN